MSHTRVPEKLSQRGKKNPCHCMHLQQEAIRCTAVFFAPIAPRSLPCTSDCLVTSTGISYSGRIMLDTLLGVVTRSLTRKMSPPVKLVSSIFWVTWIHRKECPPSSLPCNHCHCCPWIIRTPWCSAREIGEMGTNKE
jgi:hypothetical protein